jgi:transposase
MQQLYAIERKCKDLSYELRKDSRQKEAVPILESLSNWMQEKKLAMHAGKIPPQSPIGKAITYCTKRWEKRCRYTWDGMLLRS